MFQYYCRSAKYLAWSSYSGSSGVQKVGDRNGLKIGGGLAEKEKLWLMVFGGLLGRDYAEI